MHNARASGQVRLARRRDTHAYAVREVRGYFQADQNDPVERFIAEAEQHPVFELTPIGPDSPPLSREGPGPE